MTFIHLKDKTNKEVKEFLKLYFIEIKEEEIDNQTLRVYGTDDSDIAGFYSQDVGGWIGKECIYNFMDFFIINPEYDTFEWNIQHETDKIASCESCGFVLDIHHWIEEDVNTPQEVMTDLVNSSYFKVPDFIKEEYNKMIGAIETFEVENIKFSPRQVKEWFIDLYDRFIESYKCEGRDSDSSLE